ncbi:MULTISPECIES: YisL family protein [Bacillaceae]|uniref:YisL family protein n=1 Tax=Evansella alkalicola TaxID=745819 RepID=A0ABS6JXD4_9BACI|nr:YisL family protein [Litchfieldia alkalitelluris]MBU9721887.1 YisL family protein [Bacillus alkalicola]
MAQHYNTFLHSHGLFWFLTILLFVLAVIFIGKGNAKIGKIMQMTLRLFYLLVGGTGIFMIIIKQFYWETLVKGLLAFWLIFTMELITNRMAKGTLDGKSKMVFWVQFGIALILTLYFGFSSTGRL